MSCGGSLRFCERSGFLIDLRNLRFGIEIELTGITRKKASEVAAAFLGGQSEYAGTYYKTYTASDRQGRRWKFTSDGSINTQKKEHGRLVSADNTYSTEFVSPICTYEDIPVIQELVRQLRHNGAIANDTCGIHVHVDASAFDARTLRNLCNIMYSKEDILYRALQVAVDREHRYCQKTEDSFINELDRRRPRSLEHLERIWYGGDSRRNNHYDGSRYHCLNLHSVFQKGTVEFRLFNGTTHAGKIKAYIQLCLAISAQALTQRCASRIKTQSSNEKYTFRTWLLRMGLIGDEFATARLHLLEHLEGDIAWRDPAQGIAQRERLRLEREAPSPEDFPDEPVPVQNDSMEMEM